MTDTRTALVTGSTSGIGKATAIALAAQGLNVVVSGRDETRGRAVVDEIRSTGGRAEFVAADLTNADSARTLTTDAEAALGAPVDVLVNNVGGGFFAATADTSEADFDGMFTLNVNVPYFLTAAIAPGMAERGHGAIVNVTTMVADFGLAGMSAYGSAKAALNLLTKNWAAEFGPHGVRVNAVSPGPIRTEGTERMGSGLDQLAAGSPTGRAGTPQEVAEAIAYLASPAASFTNGVILPVDGGRLAV